VDEIFKKIKRRKKSLTLCIILSLQRTRVCKVLCAI